MKIKREDLEKDGVMKPTRIEWALEQGLTRQAIGDRTDQGTMLDLPEGIYDTRKLLLLVAQSLQK